MKDFPTPHLVKLWSKQQQNQQNHQKTVPELWFLLPSNPKFHHSKKHKTLGHLELHSQKSGSCDWFDPLEDCKLPGRDFWSMGLMVLSGGHRWDSWKTHQKIITATRNTIHIHTLLLFLTNQCFYIVARYDLFDCLKNTAPLESSPKIMGDQTGWYPKSKSPGHLGWRSNSLIWSAHSVVPKPMSLKAACVSNNILWLSIPANLFPLLTAIPAIREQESIFPLKMAFVKAGHTSIPAAMGKPLGPRN